MGLFDKKICDVCGGEIGLLGNRKLSDGNLCKNCASKLSPWFSDRRSSTVSEIKDQLAYREDNMRKLADFKPTLTLGAGTTKIHIDEKAKKFIVTRSTNWERSNPDIIDISQVKDCRIDVSEDREEIFDLDKDGKEVSYNPPKFTYEYEFDVQLDIDSPYFPEIEFELAEDNATGKDSAVYEYYEALGRQIQSKLIPGKYPFTASMQAALKNGLGAAIKKDEEAAKVVEEETSTNDGLTIGTAAGTQEDPTRWFCPNCGTECHGNFCVKCGNKRPI